MTAHRSYRGKQECIRELFELAQQQGIGTCEGVVNEVRQGRHGGARTNPLRLVIAPGGVPRHLKEKYGLSVHGDPPNLNISKIAVRYISARTYMSTCFHIAVANEHFKAEENEGYHLYFPV